MATPMRELEMLLVNNATTGAVKAVAVEFVDGSSVVGFCSHVGPTFTGGGFALEVTPFVAEGRKQGPVQIDWRRVLHVVVTLYPDDEQSFVINV